MGSCEEGGRLGKTNIEFLHSLVTWKADETSNIDMTVFDCTNVPIYELKETLEESNLLISVDVMNWEEIPDNFKTNIKKQYVVLQEKNKMKGWREVKLGDVAELSKVSWKIYDEPFPYIGLEHINENKLRLNSIGDSSSVASNKYRFKTGDILFGKLRPYFRKVLLAKFDGICSTDIWVVKPKGETDNVFLFYFFANTALVDISYSSSSGTRMPRADWTFLSETSWNLPPLPEQKAIAEVLSSLDDKIDLLHRQNKTLENMAQTLFRQWFVEQADTEWEEVKLGDFFPVITGKKDVNYSTTNGEYPFFTCSHTISHAPNYSFDGKAILLAGNGNFNVKRYEGKFEAYQRVYVLIPHEDKYCGLLYTLTKFHLKEITIGARGSVIRFITKGMITDFTFTLPKTNFDDKLDYINDTYQKVDSNQAQINTLENLRDTLLPKLMSGEVSVTVGSAASTAPTINKQD